MKSHGVLAWTILAALSVPLFSSCVTEAQHRAAMDERSAEIRALREERTALKTKLRDIEAERQSLESALVEAGAQIEAVASQPQTQRFPDLDELGIGYGTQDGNLVISIPASISFASGKAQLSDEGTKAVRAVAKTLKMEYPAAEYWIEGHTDSDPIKKSKFATNRDLSLARSMAVLHFLVESTGVLDEQCVVAGWGEYEPVASNDTKANKAKNRRVEIVVHQ